MPGRTRPERGYVFTGTCASVQRRLLALDALRGFTMFWIVGGREVVLVLAGLVCSPSSPALHALKHQLSHARWWGFVGWDMIMPMFLFVVGAAMPLAMLNRRERGQSLKATYWRIARRVVVLWLLGILVQMIQYEPDSFEIYSNTLQAIAVGYLVTSLALLHLPLPGQLALLIALVMGYWGLLTYVPFAGHEAGTLTPAINFARYVNELVLGHFRRHHSFTWIVTSLGFAATVLLGAMAGHLLRAKITVQRRLFWLAGIGLALMAVGWEWSYWMPLNRHLWTSSMIVWTGGCSFVALAMFYAVIDVGGFHWWAFPFIVIGSNALLAYLLDPVLDAWSEFFLVILGEHKVLSWGRPLLDIGQFAILWLVLWVLYRKRLFWRV